MNILGAARVDIRGTGTQTIQRSRISNSGLVTFGQSTGLELDANVTNFGTLDAADRAVHITGDFTAGIGSTLKLLRHEFGFIDNQIDIDGAAHLDGALVLAADWPMIPGYQWRFMRAAGHTGAFDSALGANDISGRSWAIQWVGALAWATLGA